jgi:hypothetical protein
VTNGSRVDGPFQGGRNLNAVALQNAVLCAECDVVSGSPHDRCLVCGSRSLFNIARMFGGNLPKDRANLIISEVLEMMPRETVLTFPGFTDPEKRQRSSYPKTRRWRCGRACASMVLWPPQPSMRASSGHEFWRAFRDPPPGRLAGYPPQSSKSIGTQCADIHARCAVENALGYQLSSHRSQREPHHGVPGRNEQARVSRDCSHRWQAVGQTRP